MFWASRIFTFLFPAIVVIAVFFLTLGPLKNLDMWFHIKSGEVFSKQGIIFHDVFSFTAQGRELFPYEWFFQVSIYQAQNIFGLESIKYFLALLGALHILIFYFLLKKVLEISTVLSASISFLFFGFIFEFLNPRPQLFGYSFLLINLFLILLYFLKNKNLLFLTIPITWMWANSHGSVFLDPILFFAYGFLSLFLYFKSKEKSWLKKLKTLSAFGILSVVLTILPPLGLTQYKLLWIFFQKREVISRYIEEWGALSLDPNIFIFVSVSFGISALLAAAVILKKKNYLDALFLLPLLPLVFSGYLAVRNVYLAYLAIFIIFAWAVGQVEIKRVRVLKIAVVAFTVFCFGFGTWAVFQKKTPERLYYPINATRFILDYDLKGHMFNEYGYGGYLLYKLYPKQQVFIDGRTDIYLCCEMPLTLELSYKKNDPDNKYREFLNTIWDKYDISFVLMRTQKHSVLRKIARILTDDPGWSLVFWDDDSQIYVRRNGKNDQIIKQFGAAVATPYNKDPYNGENFEEALKEYEKMIQVVDSAKSRNAVGYIYLLQKKFDEAKGEFDRAIGLDPTNESPYMNLGELAVRDRDYQLALEYYRHALKLAPDRGLIYLRLGQIYIEGFGDVESAKKGWNAGIKNAVDDDVKEKMRQLLEI